MDENKPKKRVGKGVGTLEHRDQFSTFKGHVLTPKEAKFIDEFIKTGNGGQSVLEAGYVTTAPRQYAQRLLNKEYIIEEINHRLEQAKDESIADATEIMRYFTDVMRGNITDQFGLEAPLSERTKCAQELAKRQIDIPNRQSGADAPKITITVDWGEDASANVDFVNESVDTESIQKVFDVKPQVKDINN